MEYEIKQVERRRIAGFHMVGPWEHTVKQGFEQLVMWVDGNQIVPLEWIAVYYDNPDVVPADKLRCDTVVSVPEGFEIPENSEGVILTELAGGDYAVAVARVENHDFATPRYQFLTVCCRIRHGSYRPNRVLKFTETMVWRTDTGILKCTCRCRRSNGFGCESG